MDKDKRQDDSDRDIYRDATQRDEEAIFYPPNGEVISVNMELIPTVKKGSLSRKKSMTRTLEVDVKPIRLVYSARKRTNPSTTS